MLPSCEVRVNEEEVTHLSVFRQAVAIVPTKFSSRSRVQAAVSTIDSGNQDIDLVSSNQASQRKKIPVHLLAGFLGSGKTTTLKHILENKEDVRVGVIVNDVASVNIDAKLIAQKDATSTFKSREVRSETFDTSQVVELKNGCACCSLAGELFDSIESLLPSSNKENERRNITNAKFDAIVVELSGVADPLAIKNHWGEVIAKNSHDRVTSSAELGKIVTVVDATTFGNDYLTYDILKDRDGWLSDGNSNSSTKGENKSTKKECSGNRQVAYLLAEQVEAADLIVVNKQDLAGKDKTMVAGSMAENLNEDANIIVTSHGKISASNLLEILSTEAKNDIKNIPNDTDRSAHDCTDPSHSHSHDHASVKDVDFLNPSHSHSHDHASCGDDNCTDPSHSHSHDHTSRNDDDCIDPSHSHSHDHTSRNDDDCIDPSHSHSHDHALCNDDNCTDPSHSHSHDHDSFPSHSHSHEHHSSGESPTATANLGISNFVYKATRPFDANRLMKLILEWPIPIKEELDADLLKSITNANARDDDKEEGYMSAQGPNEGTPMLKVNERKREKTFSNTKSPFVGVLRSKGFCWIAPTAWEGLLADPWRHNRAMYWTHAGKHMGIEMGGPFWASLTMSQMEEFFEKTQNPKEFERILREDFVTTEFGDRRQELVFIGIDLKQRQIEQALDHCLLTNEEMEVYRIQLERIRQHMPKATEATMTKANK